MLDLNDFSLFVSIVDAGGFTAASRSLGVPKSTLSHRIQQLEQGLGVQLLHRTSRRFAKTEAGDEFYRHAVNVLREAQLAEVSVRRRLAEPTGTVRITAGVATMQYALAELITDFLVQHPKVNVVAHAIDRAVDLVAERYDLAIRAHSEPLRSSSLVQRHLCPAPWGLFAGAGHLDAHGTPQTPDELRGRPSLFMQRSGVSPVWKLRRAGSRKGEVSVPLTPRLVSDDMVNLQRAAIRGVGIVALPVYVCRAALQSGALRRVLPEWSPGDSTLTALIPHRQRVLPSVRVFLNHLAVALPHLVSLSPGERVSRSEG